LTDAISGDTEMTAMKKLNSIQQRFILHWGEMGTRWGINRTVAQIHALLYLAPAPLNAEDIAGTLGLARSNVSTSLRELQGWRLVRLVHVLDDKRDHFESPHDVWEMFRIIADERKRREIDPTREMLHQLLAASEAELDPHTKTRLAALAGFFETTSGWYAEVSRWPQTVLIRFLRLGAKARTLLGRAG
jgi:DNA-binding transcriptional regulator GbsR (MarR family)